MVGGGEAMRSDDEPIRVLRVIARMNIGGPAWQTSVLTRKLPDYGIETRLLTGTVGPDEEDFVALRDQDLPFVMVPGLGRSVRLFGDLRALVSLIAEIRRYRPHVVHTHTAKAGVLGRIASMLCGVRLRVHTFHGHLLRGYFPRAITRLVVFMERSLARRTTTIVTVGDRVRDEVLAAGIGSLDQFVSIAPGVDGPEDIDPEPVRATFDVPSTAPVVLFVGRLTRVKRVDRLLEAFEEVLRSVPDAILLVVGDGEEMEAHRASAVTMGRAVRFVGWQADLRGLMAIADVAVISSDNEGMPVTLIEAAMAGVPGVTTDVGSAAEVVEDGVSGRVVPPDAHALAEGLAEVLADAGRRADMGRAATARAHAMFSTDRLVEDHVALYRRLLNR
ncbi:MAG: glycosyl transferase [Acidimicrobiaceae bacterium]|nr:glycosyl transferase [Acidimicrobiaceae bacterium]HAQ21950.1 glycosyltransferase family 1 protein [Acidimicrobiaceae bacterium]|tara:strand:- start:13815 stop:14981 length:1167 start_codon:yes stop_codon:yes gene_type:complete